VQQRMPPDASVHPAVAAAAAAAAASNSPRLQPVAAGNPMQLGGLTVEPATSARAGTPQSVSPLGSPSPTPEPASAFYNLPALSDIQNIRSRREVLCRKLKLCCEVYDFNDPAKDLADKDGKRMALADIADALSNTKGILSEEVYADLIQMVKKNLFRTLHLSPPLAPEAMLAGELEEDEPRLEPAWPHLQLVYEILLRFITSPEVDPRIARRYIDQKFLLGFLDLFDSEDPRERDYLKTILHRIYGKFMPLRPFIRRAIANVFLYFVFESERHNGIAELLEILGSIINGFALPLKEEHKYFLRKALIPLHIPRTVALYHQQLVYCMTQFVEKYPPLAVDVLRGLLRYWPLTNSQKEVLFLAELEEIIEQTHPREFSVVLEDLFRRIAKCMQSPHFQVAERTLFLWNNEYLVSLILQYRERVFPIVYGALACNERNHWNTTVTNLTFNVQKLMIEMDMPLYERCARLHGRKQANNSSPRWDRSKFSETMERATSQPAEVLSKEAARHQEHHAVRLTEPIPIHKSNCSTRPGQRGQGASLCANVSQTVPDTLPPAENRRKLETSVTTSQRAPLGLDSEPTDRGGEVLYERAQTAGDRRGSEQGELTGFHRYPSQLNQDIAAKMGTMNLGQKRA
jgi:serine/threonine-protein phosphatase 2A regulatory subunit B'